MSRRTVVYCDGGFGNGQNQNFLTVIGLVAIGTSLSLSTYQNRWCVGTGGFPPSQSGASALIGPEEHRKTANYRPESFTSTLRYLSANGEASKAKRSNQIEFSCILTDTRGSR
jgi:hypothetical protein